MSNQFFLVSHLFYLSRSILTTPLQTRIIRLEYTPLKTGKSRRFKLGNTCEKPGLGLRKKGRGTRYSNLPGEEVGGGSSVIKRAS